MIYPVSAETLSLLFLTLKEVGNLTNVEYYPIPPHLVCFNNMMNNTLASKTLSFEDMDIKTSIPISVEYCLHDSLNGKISINHIDEKFYEFCISFNEDDVLEKGKANNSFFSLLSSFWISIIRTLNPVFSHIGIEDSIFGYESLSRHVPINKSFFNETLYKNAPILNEIITKRGLQKTYIPNIGVCIETKDFKDFDSYYDEELSPILATQISKTLKSLKTQLLY